MQATYRKVAGKIYNQAPYDPKVFLYHNVKPTGFAKAKIERAPKITENTKKVQGKLMNSGVYDPKLNKYGITPQNYKQQYEKVQAETFVKRELTDRVTESAAGDNMEMERKQKNYAPILEQIASTGVVISKSITNPGDVVALLKQAVDDTKKSVPQSQWGIAVPEAIKQVALILIDNVRLGRIDPEMVPEFIDAIEGDADLADEEVEPERVDPAEWDMFVSEESFNLFTELLAPYFVGVFDGVTTYDEFLESVGSRMPPIKIDSDINITTKNLNTETIRIGYYNVLAERSTYPSEATPEEKLKWISDWLYGESDGAEEAAEPSSDPEVIDPFAGEEISLRILIDRGDEIIKAHPDGDWKDLESKLFTDSESPRVVAMRTLSSDDIYELQDALELLMATKMENAGATDEEFESVHLVRPIVTEAAPEVEAAPESSGPPGLVNIEADGTINHITHGNIGAFNEAKGVAEFIDGTGDLVKYKITKDELENELRNGGDTVTAMYNSNPGWMPDYKNVNLRGKVLPNGYAILQYAGSRANAIFGTGESIYRIEPLGDRVRLTKNEYTGPNTYEEKRGAPNITIPRKLLVAWVLVTSGDLTGDEKQKAINVIDAYNRPRYNNVYKEFKTFIGVDIADRGRDVVGFGRQKKISRELYNAIVTKLDRKVAKKKITKAQYVGIMKALEKKVQVRASAKPKARPRRHGSSPTK